MGGAGGLANHGYKRRAIMGQEGDGAARRLLPQTMVTGAVGVVVVAALGEAVL